MARGIVPFAFKFAKGDPPRVAHEPPRYVDATWVWGGRLGAKMGPMHQDAAFLVENYRNPYDIRHIPVEAVAVLADLDAQIASLMQAKRRFVEEHFLSWALVKPDDVQRFPGRTKRQVTEAHA